MRPSILLREFIQFLGVKGIVLNNYLDKPWTPSEENREKLISEFYSRTISFRCDSCGGTGTSQYIPLEPHQPGFSSICGECNGTGRVKKQIKDLSIEFFK